MTKNENKAVEFRIHNQSQIVPEMCMKYFAMLFLFGVPFLWLLFWADSIQVVFEEQSAEKGVPSDSAPMPIKNLLIQMEKRGFMDTVVTAHKVERPAAVMRGEESDRSG